MLAVTVRRCVPRHHNRFSHPSVALSYSYIPRAKHHSLQLTHGSYSLQPKKPVSVPLHYNIQQTTNSYHGNGSLSTGPTVHYRMFTTSSTNNSGNSGSSGRFGRWVYLMAIPGMAAVLYVTLTATDLDILAKEEAKVPDHVLSLNSGHIGKPEERLTLEHAIQQARILAKTKLVESGCPGMVIAVSVDGKTVWKEGLGYADVENQVSCTPDSIFRIASISKSITMAAVARLWENGDLDIDKPVYQYLPDFPIKTWQGKPVDITLRQLLSHMAGIRHYEKDYMNVNEKKGKTETAGVKSGMELEEYFIMKHYSTISESLKLFQDDPLVHKPGSKFLYTSHGWTLVSAVAEKAANTTFEKLLKKTLDDLGMEHTYMETTAPIVANRGRHYERNSHGRLRNAPYVDLSYKWAGGGLVSNVLDLTKFGNAMLYSYQCRRSHHTTSDTRPCRNGERSSESGGDGQTEVRSSYLRPETVKKMWTNEDKTCIEWGGMKGGGYGLGWAVWSSEKQPAYTKSSPFFVSHTGGAIGASSVLLIRPSDQGHSQQPSNEHQGHIEVGGCDIPNGVVVAIIVNLTSVGLNKTAFDIAQLFQNVDVES